MDTMNQHLRLLTYMHSIITQHQTTTTIKKNYKYHYICIYFYRGWTSWDCKGRFHDSNCTYIYICGQWTVNIQTRCKSKSWKIKKTRYYFFFVVIIIFSVRCTMLLSVRILVKPCSSMVVVVGKSNSFQWYLLIYLVEKPYYENRQKKTRFLNYMF